MAAPEESIDSEDDVIDCNIDDALDEGYMDLQGTLERGFSLHEDSPETKASKYKEFSIDYHHEKSKFKRYGPTLKHLIPRRSEKCNPGEMPVDKTGLVSYTLFSWMTSYMWKAYKKGLQAEDIPLCSKYEMCDYNTQRLEYLWNKEIEKRGPDRASFKRVVWQFIRTRVFLGLALFLIHLVLGFIGPTIFMRYLIDWLSSDEPVSTGLCWVLALVVSDLARLLFFGLVWAVNYRTGVRLRAACMGLVYKKLVQLPSLGDRSVGEMVNLFANDGQRIFDLTVLGVLVIGGPFVAIGGVAYILWLLGPYALSGMLAFLVFYPVQYGISRLTGVLRRHTVKITDERVSLMNELLVCIKLIKMYAWEDSFSTTIEDVRKREKVLLEKSAYVQSISLAMSPTVPVIAAIVTFVAHIAAGNNLTPAQAMSVISMFFKVMRPAISLIRIGTVTIVSAIISILRVESVLCLPEFEEYVSKDPNNTELAVSFEEATLAWPTLHAKPASPRKGAVTPAEQMLINQKGLQHKWSPALWDVNMSIKKGELVGVCGSVGAGKSSLLYALLGQMKLLSKEEGGNANGSVALRGSIAYVGQQAWILNATVRENILMGESFDPLRYFRVIYACSLTQDLDAMPAGDLTEIGERGINISGGQKQRVSLARALYANRDVYLLDDPLSAVDGEVGWHIFRWAIKTGLKNATVIIVTHQLQFLPDCGRVIHIQNGRITEQGSHNNLMSSQGDYYALFSTHKGTSVNVNPTIKQRTLSKQYSSGDVCRKERQRTVSVTSSSSVVYNGNVNISEVGESQDPPAENNTLLNTFKNKAASQEQPRKAGALTTEERAGSGSLGSSVYLAYINAAGGLIVAAVVVVMFGINVGSMAFSSWWLSHWLSQGSGNATIMFGNETVYSDSIADNPDVEYYQIVYASTIGIILITSFIRAAVFVKASIHASTRLHEKILKCIFSSPMRFFDCTPVGRILNIFSRDMDEIDVMLPINIDMFLQNIWLISCSLVIVSLVFWQFLPMLVVLAIVFTVIRNIFRIAIRDFKRIENVSRSPLYSHVSTTLAGLPSIHAYSKQKLFRDKFLLLFDESSSTFYMFNCAMRWLAIRLDVLALGVVAFTALLTVLLKGTVAAAFAGLALAYASQLSGIFQFTVRLSTETEARFTSVERINSYIKCIPSEDSVSPSKPPSNWPQHGRISFRKVTMRYRENTPLVFNEISFDIHEKEKIGVVGRTGSGKSSLAACLFRLVELEAGVIRIDGTDISKVPLKHLRSKLSVIPQDPVLFSGTVRYNLDPFKKHADADIWAALERVHLKERISIMSEGLLARVAENGDNFSVGERQLMCMARALLRDSKILVLDEATANIDTESDAVIQRALQSAFEHCTLITIAHRLNTIFWCNRVMVMEAGTIVQFDTPNSLLQQKNSAFAKMVAANEKTIS